MYVFRDYDTWTGIKHRLSSDVVSELTRPRLRKKKKKKKTLDLHKTHVILTFISSLEKLLCTEKYIYIYTHTYIYKYLNYLLVNTILFLLFYPCIVGFLGIAMCLQPQNKEHNKYSRIYSKWLKNL